MGLGQLWPELLGGAWLGLECWLAHSLCGGVAFFKNLAVARRIMLLPSLAHGAGLLSPASSFLIDRNKH